MIPDFLLLLPINANHIPASGKDIGPLYFVPKTERLKKAVEGIPYKESHMRRDLGDAGERSQLPSSIGPTHRKNLNLRHKRERTRSSPLQIDALAADLVFLKSSALSSCFFSRS